MMSRMQPVGGALLPGPPRLSVLGRPAIVYQGVTTPFPNERRFQLLAVLAVEGHWVTRDRLAAMLWPDLDGARARRNLRKAVFQAREPAWAAALETDGDRVRWPVDTDLAAFRQAVAAGRHVQAWAMYHGHLLEGLDDAGSADYSAWLDAARAALRQQWRDTALRVLPGLGTAQERVDAAHRLLHDDPDDERALLAALGVLAADDRVAEAQGLLRDYLRRLSGELGLEPSAAVLAAVRSLQEPVPGAAAPPPLDRLRRASDAFVGRRGERLELLALLERPACRVVTICGPGGIGKSRFARELMPELVKLTRADVLWVPLVDLSTASQLLARIARVLGATINDSVDEVTQLVAQRGTHPALLVLDNAEHLPDLGHWLQPLLDAWPQLRLVCTSRARTGLQHEQLLRLEGLALPDADSRDAEAAAAFDAVRLFELRARRAQPGFVLARHIDAVLTLLERLGGMPLAIEMAADWVRLLPPEQIARELERSFELLQREATGPGQAGEPYNLQAVFRRSWDLLPPREREVLPQLTAFRGGFRSDAASAVAGASWPELASLVDRSLLTLDEHGRFGMHPLVSSWATALVPAAERPALALRHAGFYARWMDELAQAAAADTRPLVQALQPEYANAQAAWQAALAAGRPEPLAAMHKALLMFAEAQGRWREVQGMLDAALADDGVTQAQPLLRLDLQLAVAALSYRMGDLDRYEALARSALALARQLEARHQLAVALNATGTALLARGDAVAALPLIEEAVALVRESGPRTLLAYYLHNAAVAHKAMGALPAGLALIEEALAVMREIGHLDGEVLALNNLGDTLHKAGELARAHDVLTTGLRLSEERGLPARQQILRLSLGHVLIDLGRHEAARASLDRAVDDARRSGQFHVEVHGLLRLARLDLLLARPAACLESLRAAFQRAHARGHQPLALEALMLHATLHAKHGDAAYAQQLRTWLHRAPACTEQQRQLLHAQLADGTPTEPPRDFDIHVAAERLAQPLQGSR